MNASRGSKISNLQPSSTPYRVCMVGLGRHALKQLTQLAGNPTRWSIAAVVDLSVASYARFQGMFYDLRVPFYRNVAQAVVDQPIDLVIISTTAPSHIAITTQLIRTGFIGGIFIEKPVSNSLFQVDSLCRLIEQENWPGQARVDFNRRCSEIYNRIKKARISGEIGDLVSIEFNRPCKLSMVGAHFIDLANWFADSPPIRVSCHLDTKSSVDHRGAVFYDPPGRLQVEYANGVVFNMDTTNASPSETLGMAVKFTQGNVRVDNDEVNMVLQSGDRVETMNVPDENCRYRWIENAALSVLSPEGACDICTIAEAATCLEVTVAAHISNRRGGESVELPLSSDARAISMRIA
ncbi:MAG: Gfo/Idh/MocA family oxidoreductase [Caldilineales bacterium]|nr:Gfo/Idh/MocA family oxidoreductase [Caldilineales bacterium]